MLEWSIAFGRVILSKCLEWFLLIYDTLGMTSLWVGVVVLAAVFAIVIMPLRGGADLSTGAFGGLLQNQIHKHKRKNGGYDE